MSVSWPRFNQDSSLSEKGKDPPPPTKPDWSERPIICPLTLCRWINLNSTDKLHLPVEAIQSPWAKCGRRQVSPVLEMKKSECGSWAQSCQVDVIQTLSAAAVAGREADIPHCITSLLSKLYYLGRSSLYGCQSYHTKNCNSPYLALPAPTHKHIGIQKRLNAANTISIATNNAL